ncbi:hypothetical protein TRFO_33242 [Tritrichomonas foetus]|uniref:Uncharacterized protein n=1 Tax=Tritrichomonas foetus TaxID=1144522 RepID=A0A1J4JRL4_9EUKA|nr:hypothetical protein TRFO_33242 [Tritrichomonas foetus]|eukprot:OHT00164.1 hypothetical protein TRFO_33242 [Tritrichomonas foetus]
MEDNVISVSESHKQRYQRSTQFQSETSQVLSHPPPLSNSHIQLPPPPPLQYLKQQKQNSQKDEIILTPPPNRSIQRPSPTQKSPQNLSHQVYQNQQQAAQLNPPPLPPPPSSPHQQSRKPPPPSILSTELFQHYQRKRQEFIYPSPQNTKQLAKSQPRHMMEGAHNGYFDDSQPLLPQQKQQQLYTYKSKPHYQPLP